MIISNGLPISIMAKKKKVEQDHDFFYSEGRVHLYDADEFISQVKHMMSEVVPNKEFGIYVGINDKDCIDVWVRDENGTMYQVEPKNLANEESEIRLNEMGSEEEEEEDER